MVGGGCDGEGAVEFLGVVLADGEAEAGAFLGVGGVELGEGLEEFGEIVLGDADACVLDLEE